MSVWAASALVYSGRGLLLSVRRRAVHILHNRWWSSLQWRIVCRSTHMKYFSPVDNFLPIYYVGSVTVFRPHGSSSPITLLSFWVLVVHLLTRNELLQVSRRRLALLDVTCLILLILLVFAVGSIARAFLPNIISAGLMPVSFQGVFFNSSSASYWSVPSISAFSITIF